MNPALAAFAPPIPTEPISGEMTADEFRAIQTALRLTDGKTADLLQVDISSVRNYRTNKTIKGPVALAMRMLLAHSDELEHWMQRQTQ